VPNSFLLDFHTQGEFKTDPIQHLPHGTLAYPTQLKKQLTLLKNIERKVPNTFQLVYISVP